MKQRIRYLFHICRVFFCILFVLKGSAVAASLTWPALPDPQSPPTFWCHIEKRFPHDPSAFTQGLVFDNGLFWEGPGLFGASDLRKVDVNSGKVIERLSLPPHLFGEGVALSENQVYQLTWRSHEVRVYDRNPLVLHDRLFWPYQGWGITSYDSSLVISIGTEMLYFVDPAGFKIQSEVKVNVKGKPLQRLNELELVDRYILANVWQTPRIALILPESGQVAAWIDLSVIAENEPAGVANGIAWDAENRRLFVTGKKWSWIYEVTLTGSP